MNNFFSGEQGLNISPTLAVAVGLNEAIILEQLHTWVEASNHVHGGACWIAKTDEQMLVTFCFLSKTTLRRCLSKLVNLGVVQKDYLHGVLLGEHRNRTTWYTVNYDQLSLLLQGEVE